MGATAVIREAFKGLKNLVRERFPDEFRVVSIGPDGSKTYRDCILGLHDIACDSVKMGALRQLFADVSDYSDEGAGALQDGDVLS